MAQSNSLEVYSEDLLDGIDNQCNECNDLAEKVGLLLGYIHESHEGFKTTDHLICQNYLCITARWIVSYSLGR